MSVSLIVLLWACLAVLALALECEEGSRDYLTVCQVFWIAIWHPLILAVLGLIPFIIGVELSAFGFTMPLIFGAVFILAGGFVEFASYIARLAGSCPIVWERKE
jgi:hypothetical protein